MQRPIMRLTAALNAWGTPAFAGILKQTIEHMALESLPLQQGLAHSSYTNGTGRTALILDTRDTPAFIQVKAGIFYSGMIAGCSCADDPTPMSEITEYCEVQFDIDKATAQTTVTLLPT